MWRKTEKILCDMLVHPQKTSVCDKPSVYERPNTIFTFFAFTRF